MAPFDIVGFIARKRDGEQHLPGEIETCIRKYMSHRVTDYQISAWLMAAWLRGLDVDETVALTDAMLASGKILSLKTVERPKVDKHSTGGVGDKISLCLAPLAAACGLAVPMVAGRGLGHTGGTLDKLESIRGFSVHLTASRFESIVRRVGCAIVGQTKDIAPADGRLYALRDVTSTVESIPLIVASILSKKLAEGIDGLVLDVKVGRGAFMKDLESGRRLAKELVRVGRRAGKRVSALMTDMDVPTGTAIGNALEVAEAVSILRGGGPADTRELTLELAQQMLVAGRLVASRAAGLSRARRALDSGAGLETFARMVHAQGGDPSFIEDPKQLPRAPHCFEVVASRAGWVQRCDALLLGQLAMKLGAGRQRADARVDPRVGLELLCRPGERVAKGAPLVRVHAASPRFQSSAKADVRRAVSIGARAPQSRPTVLERVTR